MPPPDIPESVRQFIFSHIDSVEQLEILLLMRLHPGDKFTARSLAEQLRSTEASVQLRMAALARSGLIEGEDTGGYAYVEKNEEIKKILSELNEAHRVMRHKVLELIFSPMKKARNFADAFVVSKPSKNEEDNG